MVTKTKKAKSMKKCVIKRKLKFEVYKHCLEATKPEKKLARKKSWFRQS